jgi:pimeloyl-ACP methyl ester carboxylesterase
VRLPDGRALAYSQYGDPRGAPVINCHGGLTSRRDVEGCDQDARAIGARVISPDRPGIGLSDPKPGRTLLDWPADVVALADAVGVDRFAVLGWSFGGPYAAACASALPERVTSLTLIASAIPPEWPGMMREINRMDRVFMRLATGAPRLERLAFRAMGIMARRTPAAFCRVSMASLDESSRELLMSLPASAFSAPIAEGLRNPGGVLRDYRLLSSPWGFDLAAITQPAYVWQGDRDSMLDSSWAERLAARIPNAELRICPGEGHFLALRHHREIFAAALARDGRTSQLSPGSSEPGNLGQ